MRTQIVACVTLLAIIATPLHAQDRAAETTAWQSLAGTLQPGSFIEVRLKDGSRFKGTFMQRIDSRVIVKPRTRVAVPARELAITEIESITPARLGMSPAKKVLIGVGVGVTAITLLAVAVIANSY